MAPPPLTITGCMARHKLSTRWRPQRNGLEYSCEGTVCSKPDCHTCNRHTTLTLRLQVWYDLLQSHAFYVNMQNYNNDIEGEYWFVCTISTHLLVIGKWMCFFFPLVCLYHSYIIKKVDLDPTDLTSYRPFPICQWCLYCLSDCLPITQLIVRVR